MSLPLMTKSRLTPHSETLHIKHCISYLPLLFFTLQRLASSDMPMRVRAVVSVSKRIQARINSPLRIN